MTSVTGVQAPAPPRESQTFRETMLAAPRLLSLAGGLVFWWAALVPSQLPRSPLLQGVIGGVSFCVGYGIGALVDGVWDAVWRRLDKPDPIDTFRRVVVRALLVAGIVAAVVGSTLWVRWQNQQADLVGNVTHLTLLDGLLGWVATFVVIVLFLGIARLLGYAVAVLGARLPHRLTPFASRAISIVVVTILVAVIVRILLLEGFMGWANSQFGQVDAQIAPGTSAPTSALVSGGPGSLVPWETLGAEGRNFVGEATTTAALKSFRPQTAADVKEPIRVYVGLDSAPDPASRAALVVKELERTGAFQRKLLVVTGVTGTGWVDPLSAAAAEYLSAGDSAIAGEQYSFLPSWISFLTDRDKASEEGKALFDAVHARWAQLPESSRPKLLAYGLSLGSFGSESAFPKDDAASTMDNVMALTDAALWMGPTNDNPVWGQMIGAREPGSPAWRPVYGDGTSVRLAATLDDLAPGKLAPQVLWVQHPSDPVGWWAWSTLWSTPLWMDEPTGPDVPQDPTWFPFVSWAQQTFDLMNGFSAQPGHGHNYDPNIAGAWAISVPASASHSWTPADTTRLDAVLQSLGQELGT